MAGTSSHDFYIPNNNYKKKILTGSENSVMYSRSAQVRGCVPLFSQLKAKKTRGTSVGWSQISILVNGGSGAAEPVAAAAAAAARLPAGEPQEPALSASTTSH